MLIWNKWEHKTYQARARSHTGHRDKLKQLTAGVYRLRHWISSIDT